MPRDFSRTERVGQLIQTAMATLVQDTLRDETQALVTVTDAEVSKDFSVATIYLSVLPDDDATVQDILDRLEQHNKSLRYQLAHTIQLRRMPALRFSFDPSIKGGSRINALLQRVSG